jgi:hypothetical protein
LAISVEAKFLLVVSSRAADDDETKKKRRHQRGRCYWQLALLHQCCCDLGFGLAACLPHYFDQSLEESSTQPLPRKDARMLTQRQEEAKPVELHLSIVQQRQCQADFVVRSLLRRRSFDSAAAGHRHYDHASG